MAANHQNNLFNTARGLIVLAMLAGVGTDWGSSELLDRLWMTALCTGAFLLIMWAIDSSATFATWRSEDARVRMLAFVGGLLVVIGLLAVIGGSVRLGTTQAALGLVVLLAPRPASPAPPAPGQLPVDRFVE